MYLRYDQKTKYGYTKTIYYNIDVENETLKCFQEFGYNRRYTVSIKLDKYTTVAQFITKLKGIAELDEEFWEIW
jgi:hypothetical protein